MLLEARRMAERAAAGRQQRRKKDRAEKRLDPDYIKREIKNAYQGQQTVRYYNSVAIKVHKGEKAVDAKVIASVTAQQQAGQNGEPPPMHKLTKEEREMVRRCA